MLDERLDQEIFFNPVNAITLIAGRREEYNHVRPHSALGYHSPAPLAWLLAKQPISAPGKTQQLVYILGAGHKSTTKLQQN